MIKITKMRKNTVEEGCKCLREMETDHPNFSFGLRK